MASAGMPGHPREFGVNNKRIKFRFFPQGNSTTPLTVAAGTLVCAGGVTSVTRTATAGKFTIQLSETYVKLISAGASIQLSADTTDLTCQFGDLNLAATGGATLVIRLLAGGTNTDMAANANNSVFVTLDFQDSAVP